MPDEGSLILLQTGATHNISLGGWCSEECYKKYSKSKNFICIEIGNSAYTEFLMKDKEFHFTEDGIFLGIVKALDKNDAIAKVKKESWNIGREFDNILVYEIVY